MTTIRKSLDAELFVKMAGRRFQSVITTSSVDRDGEVLVPDGMDSTEFEKTGTVFWNHNYDIPVGKLVGKLRRHDSFIEADTEFAVRPEGYQGDFFPDFARAMVEQQVVKGVSVGFIAVDRRPANAADITKYGGGCKTVINRWKLLEYSIAPVPCNQDALIVSVGKGLCSACAAKAMFGIDVRDVPAAHENPAAKRRVIGILV